MKKSDLTGWQKVFSFTFIQNYKSKSTVISLIIMCLLIIISGPLMSIFAGSGAADLISSLGDFKIEEIYLKNETDFIFDSEEFKNQHPAYEKIKFTETDESLESLQEKFSSDSEKNLIIHINFKDEKYHLAFYRSEGSEISTANTSIFSEDVDEFFLSCRMKQMGISSETEELLNADISDQAVDIADISDEKSDGLNPFVMTAVIIYSCVIMMIVLVSSQQIAASIVVEKSSKVIETLLLSVRPLAIIVGKITATMVIIICNFAAMLVSGCISGVITTVLTAKKMSETFDSALDKLNEMSTGVHPDFSGAAATASQISITPGRIIFGIFAVIFTTVIAYLFYSVISGITGASCSTMEDLSGASTFISLSTIIGVYMVMGCTMAENDIFTKITYFFPFSGIYIVPIHYIFGKASLSDLFIIWAEIIILTAVLFRFAANIYHVLIYHKGERLKLKNIINISREQKGQR